MYCISEGDLESRGEIDLTGARLTNGLMEHPHTIGSFCLVIEGRTYYMYGTDTVELKWVDIQCIFDVLKPHFHFCLIHALCIKLFGTVILFHIA